MGISRRSFFAIAAGAALAPLAMSDPLTLYLRPGRYLAAVPVAAPLPSSVRIMVVKMEAQLRDFVAQLEKSEAQTDAVFRRMEARCDEAERRLGLVRVA